MTLPWHWITGTTVAAIGAVTIALITSDTTPSEETSTQNTPSTIAEIDPWEVFIRTDGKLTTERIEQISLEIESLQESLTTVQKRVSPSVFNSAEMKAWQRKLKSLETTKKQLKDRRHRLFLRWNLWRVDPQTQRDPTDDSPKGQGDDLGFLPFQDPGTDTEEPGNESTSFKSYVPPIKIISNFRDEVLRRQHAEQKHFHELFGQDFSEAQMARYALMYKWFESKGVDNPNVLFSLTGCYSVFITGGQRFDANQGMAPYIHSHCHGLPAEQALKNIQLAIERDMQKEKVSYMEKYGMKVTRCSKMRLMKVFNFSKNAGATDEQACSVAKYLANFINTGALPCN